MKYFKLFENFLNENLRPDEIEAAAKTIAYSMPNHTPSDDDTWTDEQIIKAFKYFPDIKRHAKKNDVDEIVKRAQEILKEN